MELIKDVWQNQQHQNNEDWHISACKYPPHHVEPGLIVTENFLFSLHFGNWFTEIGVSGKLLKVLPAAILKHLHILVPMFKPFFVIIELVNHILRGTFFKAVKSRQAYFRKFPSFLMPLPKILFFFFPFRYRENTQLGSFVFHISAPPSCFDTIFRFASFLMPAHFYLIL